MVADEQEPSETLEDLYQKHRSRLLEVLDRRIDPRLAPRLDAEGLLTETFMAARRRWDHPARRAMPPFAWLYRLALDCLIEAWRRENRGCRSPLREVPWPERSSAQLALHLADSLTSPSEAVGREEMRAGVQQALDRLKPDDREILRLRHFAQLSLVEAASVLGISPDAAAQRYVRALRRLKNYLEEAGFSGDGRT